MDSSIVCHVIKIHGVCVSNLKCHLLAPVLGVSGCGFSSNIDFSDVTHSCLCTTLTFQFFQQNHFYASAEKKSEQLLWLTVYFGKVREKEVFSKPNQFAAC